MTSLPKSTFVVLEHLQYGELRAAAKALGVVAPVRLGKRSLIAELSLLTGTQLASWLASVPAGRLRELCGGIGVDSTGRRKADLIARLMLTGGDSAPAEPLASEPARSADEVEVSDLIERAAALLSPMSDVAVARVLGAGALNSLLTAIAPPKQADVSIYEYLRAHKQRASLLSLVRRAITNNYSFRGHVDGHEVFVSPSEKQWFADGTMFLQGRERFGGLIGLYRNGEVRFAISRRDTEAGGSLGPTDFDFRTVEELGNSFKTADQGKPRSGLDELRALMNRDVADEMMYQDLLQRHPWVFGAAYTAVVAKQKLDDEHIPDFMAIRSHDGCRDIIEIKPPTLPIFGRSGAFRQEFNAAWNQAERYLAFARSYADHLQSAKGYRFRNPAVWLVMGRGLSSVERDKVRATKEGNNPAIRLMTYDELLALAERTLMFAEQLGADVAT